MSTLSDTPVPQLLPDSVSIDTYLGQTPPSAPLRWLRHDQLTQRYEWYRHMREEQPVARDPESGLWGIFRYSDVHQALTNVADFGNMLPAPPDDPITGTLLRADPPRHRELRNQINQAFTSRRVSGMREQIQALCDPLVAEAVAAREVDVVASFARVLPTRVIGSLLGIDLAL